MSQLDAGQVGWTAPAMEPRRRSMGRLVIVGGVVLAVVLFTGYVGLTFLGAQVQAELAGTIEFGTGGGSVCSVDGGATSFAGGTTVHTAAHLTRSVPAGSSITIRVLRDGAEIATDSVAFDTTGDCIAQSLQGGALSSGHYRVEYLAGSELLASGEFDAGAP